MIKIAFISIIPSHPLGESLEHYKKGKSSVITLLFVVLELRTLRNQDIVNEELYTSSDFSVCVQTESVKQAANQSVQPRHSENFILKEIPD